MRGFSVKFHTEEGNLDIIGNSYLVSFIQDAINFPDAIYIVKPASHREMPAVQSTIFWDFIGLHFECMGVSSLSTCCLSNL